MSATQIATTTPSPAVAEASTLVLRADNDDNKPTVASAGRKGAAFLPTLKAPTDLLPPLVPFAHSDPGLRALVALSHPEPSPSIFAAPNVTSSAITPVTGRIYTGLLLDELDEAGRDEVALEVARRGVVAFRGQRFTEKGPEWYKQWGAHFGRLHVHPTSLSPEGHPEIHLVYREGTTTFNYEAADRVNTLSWHSDVSYELQPPGLTSLFLIEFPESGGDTLYADMREAYRRLSPAMQAFLSTLSAVHSGVAQANHSLSGARGGIVRRQPVEHVHPLVRVHPVTGDKSLYVNEQFVTSIVGLRREESEALLKLLNDHVARGADFHARLKWEKDMVILWDNRVMNHTAIVDFKESGATRFGCRVTPQAERPVGVSDAASTTTPARAT